MSAKSAGADQATDVQESKAEANAAGIRMEKLFTVISFF
jgi:hypothetical protein